MQSEPFQFGTMTAARAKRAAAGFTFVRSTRKSSDVCTATMLDEAFADYTRVDGGMAARELSAIESQSNLQTTTRELIADISAQLATLDMQRRQLAKLLESVEGSATV
jgi:hypothetical protein